MKEVPIIDINPNLSNCIHVPDFKKGEEIITNSNEEYKQLLNRTSLFAKCENPRFINFSQYTLLCKYTEDGGCSINSVRKVYQDNSNKKVVYSIKVVEREKYAMNEMSMDCILISKISSDYSLEFELE